MWEVADEMRIFQHEFYKEFLAKKPRGRDVEADAEGAELPREKLYNVEEEVD